MDEWGDVQYHVLQLLYQQFAANCATLKPCSPVELRSAMPPNGVVWVEGCNFATLSSTSMEGQVTSGWETTGCFTFRSFGPALEHLN